MIDFDTLLAKCRRPLPFTGPNVLAIADGRKTQTRRIIKPQPDRVAVGVPVIDGHRALQPRFAPGDLAYVAEGIERDSSFPQPPQKGSVVYSADKMWLEGEPWTWKPYVLPSRFMPKRLARTILRIDEVRAERVGEISEDDALAEGMPLDHSVDPVSRPAASWFAGLWNRIHRKPPDDWDSDPWVWVYRFHKEATR